MLFGICPCMSRTAKFWHTYVILYSDFMVIVEPFIDLIFMSKMEFKCGLKLRQQFKLNLATMGHHTPPEPVHCGKYNGVTGLFKFVENIELFRYILETLQCSYF